MARVFWGLIFVSLAMLAPGLARASCAELDYRVASTSCSGGGGWTYECEVRKGTGDIYEVWQTGVSSWGATTGPTRISLYTCRPCDARPLLHQPVTAGNTVMAFGGCEYSLVPDAAGAVQVCTDTAPVVCTGTATWQATGLEVLGGPAPVYPEPPVPDAPSACNYGSCYEPGTDEFCAVGSGGRVCVPAQAPPGDGQACISSGDTTLCSGVVPPTPPNPPVSDPASQIASSDEYSVQRGDVATSPISTVTVNNYNTSGKVPNNGGDVGDLGDAPDPDAGTDKPDDAGDNGDGTSASGGGNCNSPPICEGSQATCMVVTQTFLLRCPPGGGQGADDTDGTVPGLDGIAETAGPELFQETSLLDKLDSTGFGGGNACPVLFAMDLPEYGIQTDGLSPEWCGILEKAGYMLMLLAAFISLRILSEK